MNVRLKEGDFILKDTETLIEEPERIDILVGVKCGCLQVLDDGAEYLQVMDIRISNIREEKTGFVKAVEEDRLVHKEDWYNLEKNIVTPAYVYKPINFKVYSDSVSISDFDEAISRLLREKEIKHYKCVCKKCGKIRYYSDETLQTQPKFCYRPMYCSSRFTYSSANYEKKKKYEESVCLVDSKDAIIPAEEYCDSWNEKRKNGNL